MSRCYDDPKPSTSFSVDEYTEDDEAPKKGIKQEKKDKSGQNIKTARDKENISEDAHDLSEVDVDDIEDIDFADKVDDVEDDDIGEDIDMKFLERLLMRRFAESKEKPVELSKKVEGLFKEKEHQPSKSYSSADKKNEKP